ncbi:MAG TPA: c-type cytochrome, partial [Caulobacteraceae bacterium]|nr:c-type cytochrome [Caulobacteraceae bacterium]
MRRRTNRFLLAGGLTLLAAAAAAQTPGNPAKGADAFNDRCSSCHVLGGVAQGPNLIGVVGRRAATEAGYPYSDPLKASGLTWTPANLDRFLQSPQKLVPG